MLFPASTMVPGDDVERVALDLQGLGLAQLLEAGRRENGGQMEETLGKSGKNRWEHGGKLEK